jgi:hypothetical protein
VSASAPSSTSWGSAAHVSWDEATEPLAVRTQTSQPSEPELLARKSSPSDTAFLNPVLIVAMDGIRSAAARTDESHREIDRGHVLGQGPD